MTVIRIVIGKLGTATKGTEEVGNKWMGWIHPSDNIIKIGHNAKTNSKDLRILAVIQDSSGKPSASVGVKKILKWVKLCQ